MNVIVILIDSCNRHYLSAYGCKTVRTPNIEHLAYRGVTFTNHMIGSAPCMPARREFMTGRREFLWRGWGHLEQFDAPLAIKCRQAGAVTQMVTDHYHYWEGAAHGYFEYFDGCEMVRGNETDFWKTKKQPDIPQWARSIDKYRPGWGSRYYRNVAHFRNEEDFFSPKVYKQAADWLEENHDQEKFLLWIESFDPHEPFHVPEPYRSMYCDRAVDEFTCWPPYQHTDQRLNYFRNTSMEELAYVRSQYQGKLTMVDNAVGRVWHVMDKYRLWENTMVILTTDHGHDLCEAVDSLAEIDDNARDKTGRIPYGKQHPHYPSHANIPMIIWHPELMQGGKKTDAMTTAVDIYPTVIEALGGEGKAHHGRSLLPILRGETWERDFTYWGTYGEGICCTDGRDVLMQGANTENPLYWYSGTLNGDCAEAESGKFIPGVGCPVWKIKRKASFDFPDILIGRNDKLFEEKNRIGERPETAAMLRRRLREQLEVDGCPPEQFDRLGL